MHIEKLRAIYILDANITLKCWLMDQCQQEGYL